MVRRLIISTLLAAACCATLGAQGVLTWLESEHDFGVFNENEERVSCVMRAVNTGTEPVVIERVQTTCGCTTPQFTKTPIAVGDTATVKLTYNAIGRVGAFDKTAYVFTNTAQRKFTLRIKGSVLASAETINSIYPHQAGSLYLDRKIISFGEMTKGASKVGYIGAYNNSTDTLTVSFDNVPPFVEIEAFPLSVPPFGLCTISAFFNSFENTQWGLNSAEITLTATHGTDAKSATIDVVGTVNEDFSNLSMKQLEKAPIALLSDEVVDFGKFSRQMGTVRQQFTITNSGNSPLLIRRIYCPYNYVGTEVDATKLKPGQSCTVSVAVNAAAIEGIYLNTRLTVITNDPSQPKREVRLSGIVDTTK
ncbi:MAG: DUF1573 domain-containing protein [Muribaculaceae bacterium]